MHILHFVSVTKLVSAKIYSYFTTCIKKSYAMPKEFFFFFYKIVEVPLQTRFKVCKNTLL